MCGNIPEVPWGAKPRSVTLAATLFFSAGRPVGRVRAHCIHIVTLSRGKFDRRLARGDTIDRSQRAVTSSRAEGDERETPRTRAREYRIRCAWERDSAGAFSYAKRARSRLPLFYWEGAGRAVSCLDSAPVAARIRMHVDKVRSAPWCPM